MRAAARRAARVRCIHSRLMIRYTPRRIKVAIQKAGVTALVMVNVRADSKRRFPCSSFPAATIFSAAGENGSQEGLNALTSTLAAGSVPGGNWNCAEKAPLLPELISASLPTGLTAWPFTRTSISTSFTGLFWGLTKTPDTVSRSAGADRAREEREKNTVTSAVRKSSENRLI